MAFKIKYNNFKYKIIFFKLLIALASFQSYINKVLFKNLDIFMIFCLNNHLFYIKQKNHGHIGALW